MTEKTADKGSSTELSGELLCGTPLHRVPRLESIQKSADEFMKKHPKTKIKIRKRFLGMTFIQNGQLV